MWIAVCGPGCSRCHAVADNTRKALQELGLSLEVEEIRDPNVIAGMGVMMTPGLLIDGIKVSEGRIPTPAEIKAWIGERTK